MLQVLLRTQLRCSPQGNDLEDGKGQAVNTVMNTVISLPQAPHNTWVEADACSWSRQDAGEAAQSPWAAYNIEQWLFWEGENCCGVVTPHTHPVGVHDELQDVAGVSGQGANGCAWDQLTVVLEKYHKYGLLMMDEHAMACPNSVQAHEGFPRHFDGIGDHSHRGCSSGPTSSPRGWLCIAAVTW